MFFLLGKDPRIIKTYLLFPPTILYPSGSICSNAKVCKEQLSLVIANLVKIACALAFCAVLPFGLIQVIQLLLFTSPDLAYPAFRPTIDGNRCYGFVMLRS
jgi:uncharacterized membrane protein YGL010W